MSILSALVPLAHASRLDPTWIGGLYDDADYDDVVEIVKDAAGVSSSQAPARVQQVPVACVLLPEPGPVPQRTLRTQMSRGPPIEARDASVNLQSNPAIVRIFREAHRSPTIVPKYARASFRNRVSVRSWVLLLHGRALHFTTE